MKKIKGNFTEGDDMANIEKVIKGVWQCWLPSDEEEYETQCYDCPYYERGITLKECMTALRKDTIELLKEQQNVIEQYHKADSFLDVHGWKWSE